MSNLCKTISKVAAIVTIVLWGTLTLFVLWALVDKWNHPVLKSISAEDMADYCKISLVLTVVFFVAKLLQRFFTAKNA